MKCAEHAADAASARADASASKTERDDALCAQREANAALAEATRHKSALESRVERAEGAVAAAEAKAVDAAMEAASEADAEAARARLRVVLSREFHRANSTSNSNPNPNSDSVAESDAGPEELDVDGTTLDEDLGVIRARLGVAEEAVRESLESRAASERALAEGAAALAAVIAERNALAARCGTIVEELGNARARTARASAEAFELRHELETQRRRADECEGIASRLDVELEAALAKIQTTHGSDGAFTDGNGTYRRTGASSGWRRRRSGRRWR